MKLSRLPFIEDEKGMAELDVQAYPDLSFNISLSLVQYILSIDNLLHDTEWKMGYSTAESRIYTPCLPI